MLMILLLGSIIINMVYYRNIKDAEEKINHVNTIIASNVESNMRQSIMYIQELIDTGSPQALQNLERTVGTLTLAFNHWVDLNQTRRNPNERMQRSLSSIEGLRNIINHHLSNQYTINENQLLEADIQMLENVNEQLKRLLLVYHNIEDRLLELKNPIASDGGLIQISDNLEEITRLYRHSKLPNKHPKYITYEEAIVEVEKKIPFLKDFSIKEEKPQVIIRDGIHYYEVNYFEDKEEAYYVWADATDGNIRNFELRKNIYNGKMLSQNEAIAIARNFTNKFYRGDMKEEMFYMEDKDGGDAIYSFRFTPIKEDVGIVSDASIINVSTSSGEVLKYTNDFTDTRIMPQEEVFSPEELQERHKEEFGMLEYQDLAVVRSFYTRYQPRLTYRFKTMHNQQETMIFIDVTTGMPVYQLYYVHYPIFN